MKLSFIELFILIVVAGKVFGTIDLSWYFILIPIGLFYAGQGYIRKKSIESFERLRRKELEDAAKSNPTSFQGKLNKALAEQKLKSEK